MREQDASDAPAEERAQGDATPDAEASDDAAVGTDGENDAVGADGAAAGDGGTDDAGNDGAAVEATATEAGGGVDEALVERVAGSDPGSIAREIAELRVEVEALEGKLADREETIDEFESKLARARADFQNYKKRAEARREEEAERAKAALVERLLGVHDNLGRALEQDEDADIRGGIESTLQQFDDVLAAEDVTPIDPAPGDEVDPHRHEVLVRVASDRPEGAIDDVHRVGYEMGETIVREAQVTVSDGSSHDGGDGSDGGGDSASDEDEASDGGDGRDRQGGSDE